MGIYSPSFMANLKTIERSGKIVNSIAKRSQNFVPLCLCTFATLYPKSLVSFVSFVVEYETLEKVKNAKQSQFEN